MSVPATVRVALREKVWSMADAVGWLQLNNNERSLRYDQWTADEALGGLLSRYMDHAQVRVYIKDTLLNGYLQHALADPERALRVLKIDPASAVVGQYNSPHGVLLRDGRLVSWGHARDWRYILLSLFERGQDSTDRVPYAAVLFSAHGKFAEDRLRTLVDALRVKLGVEKLVWLER